jgi:hypothetical protein
VLKKETINNQRGTGLQQDNSPSAHSKPASQQEQVLMTKSDLLRGAQGIWVIEGGNQTPRKTHNASRCVS